MGIHLWDDYDLCRETIEDRRRDEPDETEMQAMREALAEAELERGLVIGTRVAAKRRLA